MNDKYYTPDITEFHVGFEYEERNRNSGRWSHSTVSGDSIEEVLFALKQRENDFRVKTLDREDIESLGWREKKTGDDSLTDKFVPLGDRSWEKGGFWLSKPLTQPNHFTLGGYTLKGKRSLRFSGTIRNKSELKKVMEMVGVQTKIER